MAEVVIIGNGFDLHHGLLTSYGAFASYAQDKSPSVYVRLSELFLSSYDYMGLERPNAATEDSYIHDRWCDFESCLGLIDEEEFVTRSRDDISEYMEELGMEETLVDEFIENIASILETFRDWVSDIDLPASRRRNFTFKPASLFVNFNYTETLETFYGIKPANILYIHGRREKDDQLIVGHDIKPPQPQSKHDLPDIQYNPFYSYLRFTRKPVETIVPRLKAWMECYHDVDQISVRGHSLGYVDRPYFEALNTMFPTAKWSFSYYSQDDLNDILAFVTALGINAKNISSVATLSEFEHNPNTSSNALW